jgi:hypothetical protein
MRNGIIGDRSIRHVKRKGQDSLLLTLAQFVTRKLDFKMTSLAKHASDEAAQAFMATTQPCVLTSAMMS